MNRPIQPSQFHRWGWWCYGASLFMLGLSILFPRLSFLWGPGAGICILLGLAGTGLGIAAEGDAKEGTTTVISKVDAATRMVRKLRMPTGKLVGRIALTIGLYGAGFLMLLIGSASVLKGFIWVGAATCISGSLYVAWWSKHPVKRPTAALEAQMADLVPVLTDDDFAEMYAAMDDYRNGEGV